MQEKQNYDPFIQGFIYGLGENNAALILLKKVY